MLRVRLEQTIAMVRRLRHRLQRSEAERIELERERDEARALVAQVYRHSARELRPSVTSATRSPFMRPVRALARRLRIVRRLKWRVVLLLRPARRREAHLIASSGLFDVAYYLRRNPTIAEAGINPLAHYVLIGSAYGRQPNPLFDPSFYRTHSPDCAGEPLAHFIARGAAEGRSPHPLFDIALYTIRRGITNGQNPLADYLHLRAAHLVAPHPLFDPAFYFEQRPDVAAAGANPLVHYLEYGHHDGVLPHRLFDSRFYLTQHPAVASAGLNPLLDYVLYGNDGRKPNVLFDAPFYLGRYPDVAASRANPLVHYVSYGAAERRDPHPYFDSAFYERQNPELRRSRESALEHFVRVGALEGCDPSPRFSIRGYWSKHPGVVDAGINALAHFLSTAGPATPAVAARAPESAKPMTWSASPIVLEKAAAERRSSAQQFVLCITHVPPVPQRAGNEYRTYRLLKWLQAEGYCPVLILAPLPDEVIDEPRLSDIAREFPNVVLVGRDGHCRYQFADRPDVGAALDGHHVSPRATVDGEPPCPLERVFCHDVVVAVTAQVEAALRPCVVVAQYVWMTPLLPALSGESLKVCDTIDLFSTKRDKVIQFGIDDASLTSAEEAQRLRRADVLIAIQEEEGAELARMAPDRTVLTVGVDFDVMPYDAGMPAPQVLYVASDNPLNVKGLRDFLRFAWPTIRRQVPEARLAVAGRVGRMAPLHVEGVKVLGFVDDLDALYRESAVVINPAVAGTGLKIKTLEALAHSRPVVSWPSGTDGLPAEIRPFCVVAHDWYVFAHAVVKALRHPATLAPEDRDTIVRAGSPDHVYETLSRELRKFFDGGRER
jgi:hypothetical protein